MKSGATTGALSARPRIAIVSDPLVQRGGAERVVEALAEAFPAAPIFALLYSSETGPNSFDDRVQSTWLGSIPGASNNHRLLLPLYRQAIESVNVSQYDVILSSHHTVAKGILTHANQVHISYCHTPMRALWERTSAELSTLPGFARPLGRLLFSNLRVWDVVTASRVQHFVANGSVTQKRIATYYRRESAIVHPPIDTQFFTPGGDPDDYYLVVSRPVPYKRVDIAIGATAALGRRLKIVGGRHSLRDQPPNVEILGHVSNEQLRSLMRGARALLFPQIEDFGMAPLEVNACGRPVIAFAAGGALDTVVDGVTGVLAGEQSAPGFVEAIERFERSSFDSSLIRSHATNFSKDKFIHNMRTIVSNAWSEHTRV